MSPAIRRGDFCNQLNTIIAEGRFFSHPSCLKSYTSRQHIERRSKRSIDEDRDIKIVYIEATYRKAFKTQY